ncbi:MAG: hypothetical protein ACRDOB_24530 [Streptosporangiaceae bacterium]
MTVNPGGGSGWDEPPLDIQVPDDARELERDVLAYHRELRSQRRRKRLRRLTAPFGQGTVLPLLASILAVCLVAGAMLSVATFSPATAPSQRTHSATAAASSTQPVKSAASPVASANAGPTGRTPAASPSGSASPSLSTAQATRSGPTHAPIPGGP